MTDHQFCAEELERKEARIRELEADVIDLKQLIAQWQKNCTGMNGSQKPCGMSASHTVETSVQPRCVGCVDNIPVAQVGNLVYHMTGQGSFKCSNGPKREG